MADVPSTKSNKSIVTRVALPTTLYNKLPLSLMTARMESSLLGGIVICVSSCTRIRTYRTPQCIKKIGKHRERKWIFHQRNRECVIDINVIFSEDQSAYYLEKPGKPDIFKEFLFYLYHNYL